MREDEIANRTGRVAGWLPLWLPGWQTGRVVAIRTGRVVAVMASIKTTCGFSSRADLIRNFIPLMTLLREGAGEEKERERLERGIKDRERERVNQRF